MGRENGSAHINLGLLPLAEGSRQVWKINTVLPWTLRYKISFTVMQTHTQAECTAYPRTYSTSSRLTSTLLPKCFIIARGRMTQTLTMMIKTFPFMYHSLQTNNIKVTTANRHYDFLSMLALEKGGQCGPVLFKNCIEDLGTGQFFLPLCNKLHQPKVFRL